MENSILNQKYAIERVSKPRERKEKKNRGINLVFSPKILIKSVP